MRLVGAMGRMLTAAQLTARVRSGGTGPEVRGAWEKAREPASAIRDGRGAGTSSGAAAQAMRDILVEQARRKSRLKRGGKLERAGDAELEGLADPGFELREPAEDVLKLQGRAAAARSPGPTQGRDCVAAIFRGPEPSRNGRGAGAVGANSGTGVALHQGRGSNGRLAPGGMNKERLAGRMNRTESMDDRKALAEAIFEEAAERRSRGRATVIAARVWVMRG